jgi:hypothetical protein
MSVITTIPGGWTPDLFRVRGDVSRRVKHASGLRREWVLRGRYTLRRSLSITRTYGLTLLALTSAMAIPALLGVLYGYAVT